MRISDWSSDVCSSDLDADQQPRSERNLGTPRSLDRFKPPRRNFIGRAKMRSPAFGETVGSGLQHQAHRRGHRPKRRIVTFIHQPRTEVWQKRSEKHTSELQSPMRISYAVFCLKKKNN